MASRDDENVTSVNGESHKGHDASREHHFGVRYWSRLWGFSEKTVREWFRDEIGPGILRQANVGRRSRRDYTTIMIAASAADRIYKKRTEAVPTVRRNPEVM